MGDRILIGIVMVIAAIWILFDRSDSWTGYGMPVYVRLPLVVAIGCIGLVIAFPSTLGESDTADRVRSLGSGIGLAVVILIIVAILFGFFS